MRNFYTVVQERMTTVRTGFETEPYECGWASEAQYFVRVHSFTGTSINVSGIVQVSADGIMWVDEGTRIPSITNNAVQFGKVSHFGGWLRLKVVLEGDYGEVVLTVHLVLKE